MGFYYEKFCGSWDELEKLVIEIGYKEPDYVNGPTNSKSKLRLFDKTEADVRVTLFRDHPTWFPYSQKVCPRNENILDPINLV